MNIIVPVTITDTILTSSSIAENDETEYSSGTTYVIDDVVMVTTPNVHKIYISKKDSNTGNYPPDNIYNSTDESGFWSLVSATNRWKMFDDKVQSQSVDASPVSVVLTPGELTNAIGLFGLDADALNISVDHGTETVYDEDIDLKDLSGIYGYYDWFFSPISNKQNVVLLDLPAYTDSVITVTATKTMGNVEIGEVGIARKYLIGGTENGGIENGTRLGKRTFSRKEIDITDGYATIDVQKNAKTIDYLVLMKTNRATYIDRLLSANFNVPIIFVGDEDLDWSKMFGFIKDYSISFTDSNYIKYNLRAEELV